MTENLNLQQKSAEPVENVENVENKEVVNDEPTLEDRINLRQDKWNDIITSLNAKMKTIPEMMELNNIIYAKRQDAVDYYHSMLNQLALMNKSYSKRYAIEYNNLKTNAQIRYSTESAIYNQIIANMADFIYNKTLIENHTNYMKATIETIDKMIYAIKNKIELEQLIEGVKR